MNNDLFESLKGKTREERIEMFKNCKSDFLGAEDLEAVNGGACGAKPENPGSEECPYRGSWVSSFGYVCDGEVVC